VPLPAHRAADPPFFLTPFRVLPANFAIDFPILGSNEVTRLE
jgi:hypothetical protein